MELSRTQYRHKFWEQSLKLPPAKLPPAKPGDSLDHYTNSTDTSEILFKQDKFPHSLFYNLAKLIDN